MRYRANAIRRRGFTIVEMLVAMALTIFIMAILSEAFVVGLNSFRQLKALGDMEEQLRQVTSVLRTDLLADHFEGARRLRDLTPGGASMGFFQYGEGHDPNPLGPPGSRIPANHEGVDSYGSPVARDTNDWLMFTSRLKGNRPDSIYLGSVPGPAGALPISPLDGIGYPGSRFDQAPLTYASQWAINLYFLRPDPQGLTTTNDHDPAALRLPLYHLHRRQLLLVPEAFAQGTTGANGATQMATPPTGDPRHLLSDVWTYPVLNSGPLSPAFQFATPGDVQFPSGLKPLAGGYQWDVGMRPWPITAPANPGPGVLPPEIVRFPSLLQLDPARAGADLMITDVISFDIKVWDPIRGGFVDLGFGAYDSATGGWLPTPRSLVAPRPLGNLPLDLAWASGPLPVPNWHLTQRIYSNAWVYDSWTRRIGGGRVNYPAAPAIPSQDRSVGWNFDDPLVQQSPYPSGVYAIQIKLRLWDRKTSQTRQVTIIQDM